MTKRSKMLFVGVLLVLAIPQAWAQARVTSRVECARTQGKFRVNFTAYQDPNNLAGATYLEKFCEKIPFTGKVPVTFDIFYTRGNSIVRKHPVAIRVLQGLPGAGGKELLNLPAKVYSSGIIEIELTFVDADHYHALVAIGKNASEDSTVIISFSVGLGAERFDLAAALRLAGTAAVMLIGFFVYSRITRPKDDNGSGKTNA